MQSITEEELCNCIMDNREGMYRLAYSILHSDADAQDAVGETIVIALAKRAQIRKKESARAWLMKILVNEARKSLRRSSRMIPSDKLEQYREEEIFTYDEMWPVVMELQEEFRQVVVLYYYECMGVKEISRILKIPPGTVKSRLSRAREKLFRMVEGKEVER
ncbi:MAG: RNA polymerase sigma factor [Muribaculaceae bacterium]|nr:RNA polymerase sigma factor [Roseburia sp.]MCM1432282.1 RNA polymerase sigma factor [Muribaculaceae bacterium]MCM1494058.1 RNA polymerase sigma factor [Muribaculaceae bacterium]